MTDLSASGKRFAYIDALRGLAAICVCIQHFCRPILEHAQPGGVASAIRFLAVDGFDLGRFGVVLFFLISGFVIPISLNGNLAIQRFAISRVFRLYPAYWTAIAFLLASSWALALPLPTGRAVIANLTMVPKFFHQDYVSGVFWTLFIELVFYALCASLFLIRRLHSVPVIAAIAGAFIAIPTIGAGAQLMGIGQAPVLYICAHLSFLFIGYLLRMGFIDGNRRALHLGVALALCEIVTMPLLAMVPHSEFTISTPPGVALAAVAATVLFCWMVSWRPTVTARPFLLAGAFSYSIYLFHIEAGHIAGAIIAPTDWMRAALFMIAALAITWIISATVYTVVEKPAIAMGRRINHQRRSLAVEVAP